MTDVIRLTLPPSRGWRCPAGRRGKSLENCVLYVTEKQPTSIAIGWVAGGSCTRWSAAPSRRAVSPTTVEARSSQQSSRLFERITSACAAVLRGIISPCRWREFIEPTIAKRVVETAEVNIKCAFRGCPSGLQEASFEGICGKLDAAVTDGHIVVLTAARAVFKARRVSASPDFISEGN
jgi:hypothetical protein